MLTDTITFCMQTSEHKTSLIRRLSQPDLMGSQLPPPPDSPMRPCWRWTAVFKLRSATR